jgi:hypothetical protein
MQKYGLDVDRKQFELQQGNKHIAELVQLAERLKEERQLALVEAKREGQERILLEGAMTKTLKSKEDEILSLIER